jgi:mRNA-degrading endonuclease RelE of RelBE toxin-antitoxin system
MSYSIFVIPPFDRQLKRLAKKYPSLKSEFADLIASLKMNPVQGTSLGKQCYKVRISIASKGKGKSGGARVITYLQLIERSVYLLAIYDKAEQSDIADKELADLLEFIE